MTIRGKSWLSRARNRYSRVPTDEPDGATCARCSNPNEGFRPSWVAVGLSTALCVLAGGWYALRPSDDHQRSPSPCSLFPDSCKHTAPFVFDSIHGILKQWPNTYAPNGHLVVSATIPPNTPLFHAQRATGMPVKPTFYAFDAEMSIGIYGSTGVTYMHTMTTTRPLNVLYIDGQSASLTKTGSLDSQTALLRDSVLADPGDVYIFDENRRALELCRFAAGANIDGFVRMNAGFEILVCDYAKSEIISTFHTNISFPQPDPRISNPSLPDEPHRPPQLGYGNIFGPQNGWEWIRSGAWHYGSHRSHGASLSERRVKPSFCGMASFYDPRLTSLHGAHHGGIVGNDMYQNGWGLRQGHRLIDISGEDATTVKQWVKNIALSSSPQRAFLRPRIAKCSGVDWQAMTELIVDQHKTRIMELAHVFDEYTQGTLSGPAVVKEVHTLSHAILYSYLEYPQSNSLSIAQVRERTIYRCVNVRTQHILDSSLNQFEHFIKDSIELVLTRLCSYEWDIYYWSETRTTRKLRPFELDPTVEDAIVEGAVIEAELRDVMAKTSQLITWIGWDLWYDCEAKCAYNELCYIPMWPVIYSPGKKQGSFYAGDILTDEEMHSFWKPKCINRDEFDRGGGRARDPWHQFPDKNYSNPMVSLLY